MIMPRETIGPLTELERNVAIDIAELIQNIWVGQNTSENPFNEGAGIGLAGLRVAAARIGCNDEQIAWALGAAPPSAGSNTPTTTNAIHSIADAICEKITPAALEAGADRQGLRRGIVDKFVALAALQTVRFNIAIKNA